MAKWPFRKKRKLPTYSLLKAEPARGLPQELADREASEDFQEWVERKRIDLLRESPIEDFPQFATFLKFGEGLLRLTLPEGNCLLVFTSTIRAADYIGVQVPSLADKLEFFCSSPRNTAEIVQHYREHAGITLLALDRCPRCDVFATLNPASMDKAENLISAWAISLSMMLGRCDLYHDYARSAARDDKPLTARDVALELVGHVTPEDPRTHYLLGKLGIRLRDHDLLREARCFLEFLGDLGRLQELQKLEKTGDWQF